MYNAIRHNHEHVTVGSHGGLVVGNTGPMILPEQMPALLEPFRRLGKQRVDTATSTGIGLSIVRAITDAHHGSLTVTANPGGGLNRPRRPAAVDRFI